MNKLQADIYQARSETRHDQHFRVTKPLSLSSATWKLIIVTASVNSIFLQGY